MSYKIDMTDAANVSNKVLPERETRKRLLKHARIVGCEGDMKLLFDKYDRLIRNCTNDKERADMAKMGCVEMYNLLGRGGELYIDGELVYKDS